MALTAAQIRNAKPDDRTYKLFDGRNLILLVNPCGSKLWRFRYKLAKREKGFSLGSYPPVSLSQARKLREECKAQLLIGLDPAETRRAQKACLTNGAETFEQVAREWFEKKSPGWVESYAPIVIRRLELYVFPRFGNRPIDEIGPREVLSALRQIEARGIICTAHRIAQKISLIFRYGIATGRCDRDPAADVKGALATQNGRHHPSITDPVKVGELLRAIDTCRGSRFTQLALKLAPLVFVRPGELRCAEWAEFDLDAREWRIPAIKTKMKTVHVVPLSAQAIQVIEELKPLTGAGRFVFPNVRTRSRCMSENTLNKALRNLGYAKDEVTAHGFRSTASTLLNELGWNRDAIERQLGHTERDSIRAAYNYAQYLTERRSMMQAWADYLDCLKSGENVVAFREKAQRA